MRNNVLILTAALFVYVLLIGPFASSMGAKPFAAKLGVIPRPDAIRIGSADHKQSVAAYLVFKVMVYFGTLVDKTENKIEIPPDHPAMSRILHSAVKLDPYNMDAYYFAQAILVWDAKQINVANNLLEYGMKYRTWDFYLPFFAGFNHAYFLKDYGMAAQFYKRAGELTGDELHVNLAGRYMYEAGRTDLAIAYLGAMAKSAKNDAIRKSFNKRLEALKEVRRIQRAKEEYLKQSGKLPSSVEELVKRNLLSPSPRDPYGGTFFLDDKGEVRSTSNFASRAAVN